MLYQLVVLFLVGSLVAGQGPPLPCLGRSLACALQLKLGVLPPQPSRRADCSSYQLVTVTPDPTTLTTTVGTITETVTVTGPVFRRGIDIEARAVTVTPTALPTYVFGPCTQPGIYGSACACIGITQTTTTAPPPTSFVSVTATVTTTVTVPPAGCLSAFCPNFHPYQCDSASGRCTCGVTAEGETGVCFTETSCGPNSCSASWQCEDGWACIVNTCCPQSSQCFPRVEGGCEVPLPPAGRMARFATAWDRPLRLAE